ncbi:hypothetical protein [Microbispora sp. NBRC 16548]|uniref:hypothetical protein n=1 Tax=Microbispora sp. NBRC 16548 TaxID=3030994 RepID=UPI0024A3CAAE|nr:hypothetical protein [Microbispora sp. NBRC 16548]GLX06751.1 hypothetical protein Misp03_36780 [Microbispora sp. NBRC 16548]
MFRTERIAAQLLRLGLPTQGETVAAAELWDAAERIVAAEDEFLRYCRSITRIARQTTRVIRDGSNPLPAHQMRRIASDVDRLSTIVVERRAALVCIARAAGYLQS